MYLQLSRLQIIHFIEGYTANRSFALILCSMVMLLNLC